MLVRKVCWGSADEPATLRANVYVVLGQLFDHTKIVVGRIGYSSVHPYGIGDSHVVRDLVGIRMRARCSSAVVRRCGGPCGCSLVCSCYVDGNRGGGLASAGAFNDCVYDHCLLYLQLFKLFDEGFNRSLRRNGHSMSGFDCSAVHANADNAWLAKKC